MINFSKLPSSSFLGKLLRYFLRILPPGFVIRIFQGEAKGFKWIVGAGNAGYWLGTYEAAEQKKIAENLNSDDVFYDIGAHCGFFSLIASRILGVTGKVVAFEPLPRNIEYFKRHISLNGINNVFLLESAVGNLNGSANFQEGSSTFEGRLDGDGKLTVRINRLDDLVKEGKIPPPSFLKIDVEGKLKDVIDGAVGIIGERKPKILFEADYKEDRQVFDFLKEHDYEVVPLDTDDFFTSSNFFALNKNENSSHSSKL